jgi:hypothetical protein
MSIPAEDRAGAANLDDFMAWCREGVGGAKKIVTLQVEVAVAVVHFERENF